MAGTVVPARGIHQDLGLAAPGARELLSWTCGAAVR
jgi:hypothetical protein